MADLLRVEAFKPRDVHKGSLPLLLEFPVNPETRPFLVTSTRSLIWIPKAHNGKVRAAIRDVGSVGSLFAEIIIEVVERGLSSEWGNIHPIGIEGMRGALGHLAFYDLTDVEILISPGTSLELFQPVAGKEGEEILGVPLRDSPWMPQDHMVVVPKDRDFVGFVVRIGDRIAGVIHNASRGIAVLRKA